MFFPLLPESHFRRRPMASSSETTLEAAEKRVEQLAEQDVDSVDSELRYMAYGARLRTALRAGTRYIAYVSAFHPRTVSISPTRAQTSDIGEAFRPVVPPWVVTAAYGVSWLYLSGYVPIFSPLINSVAHSLIHSGTETSPTNPTRHITADQHPLKQSTFLSLPGLLLPLYRGLPSNPLPPCKPAAPWRHCPG